MSLTSRITGIVLLSSLGGLFAYVIYKTTQTSFFLSSLFLFVICALGCTVLVFTVRAEISAYRLSRKNASFLASFIGIVIMAFNVGWYNYLQRPFDVPTLISGFYDGGFNGFGVDFKTDGTYIMSNGSGLGESFFYGTYAIKDSIITLDKSNVDNCIMTNTLVVRSIKEYSNEVPEDYILQMDSSGKEMKNKFRLRVTSDNRSQSR